MVCAWSISVLFTRPNRPRETPSRGLQEINTIIAGLDNEGAALMVSCLSQNVSEPKAFQRKESVLAFSKYAW